MPEVIRGKIINLLPQKYPTSRMFRLKSNDGATVMCVGTVHHEFFEGMTLHLKGDFSRHNGYLDFQFLEYEILEEPFDRAGLENFVMSIFQSVGKNRCKRLFSLLDDDLKKVFLALKDVNFVPFLEHPDLDMVTRNALVAIRKFRRSSLKLDPELFPDPELELFEGRYQVRLLAQALGFYGDWADLFFKKYGVAFNQLVKQDIYQLVIDFPDVSFRVVDLIAKRLNALKLKSRVKAIVIYAMQEVVWQGSTCIELEELLKSIYQMAQERVIPEFIFRGNEVIAAVKELKQTNRIVTQDKFVFLKEIFDLEVETARQFLRFKQHDINLTAEIQEFSQSYQKVRGIEFSVEQKSAIDLVSRNSLVLISGLPGTGKTLLLEFFHKFFTLLGKSILLVAPTGIAAKGISIRTGADAGTIHRKLRYSDEGWGFGPDCQYPADIVLVDETSMIDQRVLHGLVHAFPQETTMIFFGDDEQLPSVDIGVCFKDMIDSTRIPHVKLQKIFRQEEASDIIKLAHAIHFRRRMNLQGSKDIIFHEESKEEKIIEVLIKCLKVLNADKTSVKILSPEKRKEIGVWNLNKVVSDIVNPHGEAKNFGRVRFKIGDKALVTKNRYKDPKVYNGETGLVKGFMASQLIFETDESEQIIFDYDEIVTGGLDLGFVVTVHKSQGLEFDWVILIVHELFDYKLLFRNLMYTAVTRAKKKLVIIGQQEVFWTACQTERTDRRITGFKKFLSGEWKV